jgi:hypothetical protein
MNGTIYAADATVKAAGNGSGSSSTNLLATQIIANAVTISGNGTVNVKAQGNNPLTRVLRLVE